MSKSHGFFVVYRDYFYETCANLTVFRRVRGVGTIVCRGRLTRLGVGLKLDVILFNRHVMGAQNVWMGSSQEFPYVKEGFTITHHEVYSGEGGEIFIPSGYPHLTLIAFTLISLTETKGRGFGIRHGRSIKTYPVA